MGRKARDVPNVGRESERVLGNGGPRFGSPLAGRDFTRSQRHFLTDSGQLLLVNLVYWMKATGSIYS